MSHLLNFFEVAHSRKIRIELKSVRNFEHKTMCCNKWEEVIRGWRSMRTSYWIHTETFQYLERRYVHPRPLQT